MGMSAHPCAKRSWVHGDLSSGAAGWFHTRVFSEGICSWYQI